MQIKDIRKSFRSGETVEEVLKGVDITLHEGEVTALVGTSGSGKSTLLTIAAGLQSSSDGSVLFEGKDLTLMNQEEIRQIRASAFGFVFQSAHLVPFLTVEEQLSLMLDVAHSALSKKERKAATAQMIEQVGLTHRKNAYPASLSGGEKQRVAIARALVHQPKILFADEPTAALDSKRSHDIMKQIQTLTKQMGIAVLLVTHDEEMLQYADRVVEMRDGVVV
ncbi:ABC transporter ATP-binding protein [Jeotgalibacillus sp. S-D1]|uniref:ABC transporter ATP-binding protein n=1 Tax=Jeotgalibacillus sp. S-D1 TaxID=2552189 RepID=UPI00105AAB97|nr:ABC transporter ATP-binding protein [Jeotgalibacillus sp. S-D1]TDL32823.1 ABC transporter ATP-binding protein [Jeotgalibacillus sp. S-D1]